MGDEGQGFGQLLNGMQDGAAPWNPGALGGLDVWKSFMAQLSDPIARDSLLNKLAFSGVAPPVSLPGVDSSGTLGGPATPVMPATPTNTPPPVNPLLTGEPPTPIPVGPSGLQSTIAKLNAPAQQYPTSVPGGVGDQSPGKTPPLGQLLAGAQTAMKGMEQPQQQRQMAPAMAGVGSHGTAALAKAPGYLATDSAAKREHARKSLGMLLGGR